MFNYKKALLDAFVSISKDNITPYFKRTNMAIHYYE